MTASNFHGYPAVYAIGLRMGVDGFAALVDVMFTASSFAALRLVAGGYSLVDGFTALMRASGCGGVMREWARRNQRPEGAIRT